MRKILATILLSTLLCFSTSARATVINFTGDLLFDDIQVASDFGYAGLSGSWSASLDYDETLVLADADNGGYINGDPNTTGYQTGTYNYTSLSLTMGNGTYEWLPIYVVDPDQSIRVMDRGPQATGDEYVYINGTFYIDPVNGYNMNYFSLGFLDMDPLLSADLSEVTKILTASTITSELIIYTPEPNNQHNIELSNISASVQQTPSVPEPSVLFLMGLGLCLMLSLIAMRRNTVLKKVVAGSLLAIGLSASANAAAIIDVTSEVYFEQQRNADDFGFTGSQWGTFSMSIWFDDTLLKDDAFYYENNSGQGWEYAAYDYYTVQWTLGTASFSTGDITGDGQNALSVHNETTSGKDHLRIGNQSFYNHGDYQFINIWTKINFTDFISIDSVDLTEFHKLHLTDQDELNGSGIAWEIAEQGQGSVTMGWRNMTASIRQEQASVPEPSGMLLFGLGLTALGVAARRRRHV